MQTEFKVPPKWQAHRATDSRVISIFPLHPVGEPDILVRLPEGFTRQALLARKKYYVEATALLNVGKSRRRTRASVCRAGRYQQARSIPT